MSLIRKYLSILISEMEFIPANWESYSRLVNTPKQMLHITQRILEIAKNSTVIRSGNLSGHLTASTIAYESVSAHTNLFRAMVDYAIDYIYGQHADSELYYSRRVINEAILLHDLPENQTGDIADNRTRNENEKKIAEANYYNKFYSFYDDGERNFRHEVAWLLEEMSNKTTKEGCLLYTADKVSAIIMMLCYDQQELFPYAYADDKSLRKITVEELSLCEKRSPEGGILLSELWTIDYLYGRELIQYDTTGFFTALLIMTTLLVHGDWYKWRETQYHKS